MTIVRNNYHTLNSRRATSAIPGISAATAIRILLSSIISSANPTSSASAIQVHPQPPPSAPAPAPATCAITGAIFGYRAASITAASTLALIDTA